MGLSGVEPEEERLDLLIAFRSPESAGDALSGDTGAEEVNCDVLAIGTGGKGEC